MKFPLPYLVLAGWFISLPVFAQQALPEDVPANNASTTNKTNETIQTPKVVPAEPEAQTPAVEHVSGSACLLGNHFGIPEPDAQSAANLLCSEIREQGVAVQGPYFSAIESDKVYRIEMDRLGSLIIAKLSYEKPAGTVVDSRRIELARIEEFPRAVNRLVRALLKHESIEETQQVDNLVELETESQRSISSQFFWGLGIDGAINIGEGSNDTSYGLDLTLQHQGPRFSIGGQARFMGGDMLLASFGVGGRFFVLPGNISPFIGANMNLYALEIDTAGTNYENGGLGAGVEIGVEALRLHDSRLGLAFRADFPFFNLNSNNLSSTANVDRSIYAIPIGMQLYYLF
ncbi:MAG: hypothetical protein IPJ88_07215 [Myxococcales bacterium]|nr:MAG: hypothetical protein IPJ88_07215 [Myxococcales bacterium]